MDLYFPGETELRCEIQSRLAGHFDFARRLLRFWMETDKDRGLERSRLAPIVLRVALSTSVKACRQFRSVIELCNRGEAADGATIARAMFETALVVGFVLKPRFTPREYDKTGKVKKTIVVPGFKLTREMRATLFLAHQVFQPERFVAMHKSRPGMVREAQRMARSAANDKNIADYRAEIGPGWSDILMSRPYTYSGLSLANLARSLGQVFPQWYGHIYGSQSEHVHAADSRHHFQMDQEETTLPRWHETIEHVRTTLGTAIAMFDLTAEMLNHHIGFGIVMNTALHVFSEEYCRLIKAE
jgi:hypothetical protein